MEAITDKELKDFCKWYVNRFKKDVSAEISADMSAESVVATCMCGYFHTYTRMAIILLKRCKTLKYVSMDKGVVTFNEASWKG